MTIKVKGQPPNLEVLASLIKVRYLDFDERNSVWEVEVPDDMPRDVLDRWKSSLKDPEGYEILS